MLFVISATSGAQISRPRPATSTDPDYWVGLSIGYMDGITTTDDATGSTWRFGYTSQIRATFEKTVSTGTTVGVVAGYATGPLTYYPANQFTAACPGSCLAKADITQYLAFVRGGSGGWGVGTRFHGTLNAEGGVTRFSKFRDRTAETPLAPDGGSYDFTVGFGAGFGYRVSQLSEIYVDQSYDFIFHKQSSAVTNQEVPRLLTFRGGFRFGF
jgi:hypothetical protein